MLDLRRQEEFSVMRPSQLKQEGSILHNIKMREKKSGKVRFMKISINVCIKHPIVWELQVAKRDLEEKKKIAKEFNIASGLFQSHAVFMAPGTTNAILRQHQAQTDHQPELDTSTQDQQGKSNTKVKQKLQNSF